MVSVPKYVTRISGDILGIAGYYTNFYDNPNHYDPTQHVIVAAKDGNVYEVHWNQQVPPTIVGSIGYFGTNLVNIAGFYSPDDKYQHAVTVTVTNTVTNEGTLHEIYFMLPNTFHTRDHLYPVGRFDPNKGAASFFSPGDNLRHVVIVDRNGNPVDITWNAQQQPHGVGITIPPNDSQIASISGFLDTDDNSRHIIVACKDARGEVYDINYPDEHHVPSSVGSSSVITSFNEPLQNVTAFFTPDTNYRHIVVFTQAHLLKDHSYDKQGNTRNTTLMASALSNVADITSYYTADGLRHVIIAYHDGHLDEITYTSQG